MLKVTTKMPMSMGSFASRVVATKVVATDGTGDFTDIQSAIDDLPSGGGVVYIKEGTYTLTSSIDLVDNLLIVGAGPSTILQLTSTVVNGVMNFAAATNVTVRDLRVDINSLNLRGLLTGGDFQKLQGVLIDNGGNNSALQTSGNNDIIIESCTFKDCNVGVEISSSNRVIISNCLIKDNDDDGIKGTPVTGNENNDIIIIGNIITGNGAYGINLNNKTSDALIVSNFVQGNTSGAINDSGVNTQIGHNLT